MAYLEIDLGTPHHRGIVRPATVPDDFNLMGFYAVQGKHVIYGTGESETTVERYFHYFYLDDAKPENIIRFVAGDVDGNDNLVWCYEVEAPSPEMLQMMAEREAQIGNESIGNGSEGGKESNK